MAERVTHEELMRYLDGEVAPEERERIEGAVEDSTELRRDLAVFRAMKNDLQSLQLDKGGKGDSIWNAVSRQLARPLGWTLLAIGTVIWAVYGAYVYLTSAHYLWQKLATGAIGIGILVLLATVIGERYRAWLTDPYRDIRR